MRVVNTTGFSHNTRVLDDEGKDITADLRFTKIVIQAGDANRVELHCTACEIDVVGDTKE